MSNSLTPKQRAFCKYYVENERGDATEAARLAGYKNPQTQGAENLEKDNILSYIDKLETKIEKQQKSYELRMLSIHQSLQKLIDMDAITAKKEKAIAAKWESANAHNYDDNDDGYDDDDCYHYHGNRNGNIYVMRDSWAFKEELLNNGNLPFLEDIDMPTHSKNCFDCYLILSIFTNTNYQN